MRIKDYDFIKDINVLFERKIIIYGAGNYGIQTAHLLEDAGVGFECFCDRNVEIKECLGHPVITLGALQDIVNDKEYMIVVGSDKYCEEIIEELAARNILAYTCTWYGVQAGIELHIEDQRFPEWFQQDIINRRKIWDPFLIDRWRVVNNSCRIHNPVFVYQPGMVGCQTVKAALDKAKIPSLCFHTLFPGEGYGLLEEAYTYLRKRMQLKSGMKIITLFRDPIARGLSHVMQQFHISGVTSGICSYDLEAEVSRQMAEILETNEEFLWFDREIKELTGVDIYQYPFDKNRGYAWIKEGDIEILLLKTETLSKNEAIIGEFVGNQGIELASGSPEIGNYCKYIYQELVKRIAIPTALVEQQYRNNKHMDHFYTEEEKEQFCRKWGGDVLGAE